MSCDNPIDIESNSSQTVNMNTELADVFVRDVKLMLILRHVNDGLPLDRLLTEYRAIYGQDPVPSSQTESSVSWTSLLNKLYGSPCFSIRSNGDESKPTLFLRVPSMTQDEACEVGRNVIFCRNLPNSDEFELEPVSIPVSDNPQLIHSIIEPMDVDMNTESHDDDCVDVSIEPTSLNSGDQKNGHDGIHTPSCGPPHIEQNKDENHSDNLKGMIDFQVQIDMDLKTQISTCLPRKSNLRKFSAYEKSNFGEQNTTPKKKIRIVEDLNGQTSKPIINGNSECLVQIETQMFSTNSVEEVFWISRSTDLSQCLTLNMDFVKANRIEVAPKMLSIENEFSFIDNETLNEMLLCKSILNSFGGWSYENVRHKLNAFAKPNSTIFTYQSNAVKLASLDAALEFELTNPRDVMNNLSEDNLFYYADISKDSKGFQEYVSWKTYQHPKFSFSTKGFGLQCSSWKNRVKELSDKIGVVFEGTGLSNDFLKSEEVLAGPSENFEIFTEWNSSSDIFSRAETDLFIKFLLNGTGGLGVHLLVADNEQQLGTWETVKEIRYRRYIFAQCYIALSCVRLDGVFVCKIFDTLTPFTVGLVFLMYRCFKSISIHKPSGCLPATSERFLVCKGKINGGETPNILNYLRQSHEVIMSEPDLKMRIVRGRCRQRRKQVKLEVVHIVPPQMIRNHPDFFEFIRFINYKMGKQLASELNESSSLNQVQLENLQKSRIDLCRRWQIPESFRSNLPKENFDAQVQKLLLPNNSANNSTEFWKLKEKELRANELGNDFKHLSDWCGFVVGGKDPKQNMFRSRRGLYIGLGGEDIHWFDGIQWLKVYNMSFKLTKGTAVYGEIIDEISGTGNSQRFSTSFHVFDGLFLSGQNLQTFPYIQRLNHCKRFAKTLNKSSSKDRVLIKVREPVYLKDISLMLESVSKREVVGYTSKQRTCYLDLSKREDINNDPVTLANGLVFWKIGEDGVEKNDFIYAMKQRLIWWWTDNTFPDEDSRASESSQIEVDDKVLIEFVQSILARNK